MRYLFLLLLTGCSFSGSLGNPQTIDVQARQGLQQIQATLQGMGPALDKAIDEKIAAAKKK